ncbi:hypothetical protein RN001_000993 [Aquatica leii]|uniref:Angiogenic factor with G patch and FHA domains 1 n=1 Tax=Aquatica leii TaxID=1421715 RepID=A0AAN7Q7K8_9COLE|nr:hypothetical protein RN001_000993 [Aquatica leii]
MKKQFESGHSKRKRKEAEKLAKAGSDQKQRKLSFTTMGSERYELLASKSNQKSEEREPAEESDVDQTTAASTSFQGVGQNEKPRRDSTSESDVGKQVKEELIDLPSLDMHHQQSIRFPTDKALFDDLAPINLQNKLTFLAKTWQVLKSQIMETDSIECECNIMKNNSDENECSCMFQNDFILSKSLQTDLEEHYPTVLEFIKTLRKYIAKQQKKICKLKLKLRKKISTRHALVQTDNTLEIGDNENAIRNVSEEIKEAAEVAMHNTGFVYEETSGLYYDYNSGYYYNAELGLYYDGNRGVYMTYNTETQTYEFHSQVHLNEDSHRISDVPQKRSKRKKKLKDKECKRERTSGESKEKSELEEGECSDSNESDITQDINDETNLSDCTEISKAWPPCIRIIVKATEVSKLTKGSLYIITCEGGTLGREGDHSIIIPDINISKHHLKFNFNKDSNMYTVTDLGSRNGTLLNGKRMSASKQESDELELTHGSQIQIGTTILLCHIHHNHETCDHCEPGLLQSITDKKEKSVVASKSEQHKNELRKLRKKFGIGWSDSNSSHLGTGYTDRAQVRRDTVGSHNEHEKTQVASVDQSISTENKGFKLLSKMGWSEGQSLGKDGNGLLNPVELSSTVGTTGMGYTGIPVHKDSIENKNKWERMSKRYQQLNSPPKDMNDE